MNAIDEDIFLSGMTQLLTDVERMFSHWEWGKS